MARIRYGEQVKDRATKALVEALTTIGYEVALSAYRQKTYTNRTYNLHDSYGSAVYVDGQLVPDSIKFIERAYSKGVRGHSHNVVDKEGTELSGRASIKRFFEKPWIVRKKDHITLVVAAAMWYADILEKKKYVVLDKDFVKSEVSRKISKVLPPILAKYPELKGFEPMFRRWIGIDEVYYYDL